MNVSDFMLQRLAAWGVDQIYGYPGDGINGIMGARNRRSDHQPVVGIVGQSARLESLKGKLDKILPHP